MFEFLNAVDWFTRCVMLLSFEDKKYKEAGEYLNQKSTCWSIYSIIKYSAYGPVCFVLFELPSINTIYGNTGLFAI